MIGIYKIFCNKCSSSNGIYIGKSNNIEKRWNKHKILLKLNKHHNVKLQNAYNKYGIESLEFEVLELCEKDILSEREIYYIKYYDSYKNGLNMTLGGDGSSRVWSKEQKQKHSKNRIGNKNPYYGKHHNEEWKNKIIESSVKVTRKPILRLDKDNFNIINKYDSITQASKELNISITAISNCLNKRTCLCLDSIWVYESEYEYNEPNINIRKNKRTRKVAKIDINTNEIIKTYDSIASACYDIFGNKRKGSCCISDCCNGNQNTAYGFIWKFL